MGGVSKDRGQEPLDVSPLDVVDEVQRHLRILNAIADSDTDEVERNGRRVRVEEVSPEELQLELSKAMDLINEIKSRMDALQ